ncbi:hypothetical protein EPO14_01260 [Patescibacteria group bacterium]|nr:MAG: hypothetical protein EPO14_01260 [Patescibacteria group bacterium]
MTNENPTYPHAARFNRWLGQKRVLREGSGFSNKVLEGWADDFLNLTNLNMSPGELVTELRSIWGKKGAETKKRRKTIAQTPRMIGRNKEARARTDLAERQMDLF